MITRTAVHAIRALEALAHLPEGRCAGVASLAAAIGAPPNYLAKLLRTLGTLGFVRSRKGPGGGFRLARDPTTVRLIDVVEPVDPLNRLAGCLLDCDAEGREPCAVHERWVEIRDRFLALLSETTIADLTRPAGVKGARSRLDRVGDGMRARPREAGELDRP